MTRVTLTCACPEAARDDAAHMAVFHGWMQGQAPQEWQGAFASQWQDTQGNLYRVFSLPVSDAVGQGLLGLMQLANLERPPQDTENLINMAACNRAHDMIRGNAWAGEGAVPQVSPDKIVAVLGLKGTDALAAMGLTRVTMGEMP